MLDRLFPVHRMVARGLALTRGAEAVGELLAIVREYLADLEWRFPDQRCQKSLGRGGAPGLANLQVHPAGDPLDGHEQIAAGTSSCILRQVFDIDVNKARLASPAPLGRLGDTFFFGTLTQHRFEVG